MNQESNAWTVQLINMEILAYPNLFNTTSISTRTGSRAWTVPAHAKEISANATKSLPLIIWLLKVSIIETFRTSTQDSLTRKFAVRTFEKFSIFLIFLFVKFFQPEFAHGTKCHLQKRQYTVLKFMTGFMSQIMSFTMVKNVIEIRRTKGLVLKKILQFVTTRWHQFRLF